MIARRRLGDYAHTRPVQAGDHVDTGSHGWGIVTHIDERRGQATVRLASAETPPFFRPIWAEWEMARKFERLARQLAHPDMKDESCSPG